MSFVAPAADLRLQSILIATDFSEASSKALRHALAIARHYDAKFYLAHVVCSPALTTLGPEAVLAATDAVRRDALRLEDQLVQNGSLAGLRHEIVLRQGIVWEELEDIVKEQKVDMVVVGTHARRGLGKLLLGSVAEHVFRHSQCLVLTVGPGSLPDSPIDGTRPVRPFLFATDFAEPSLCALPYAISSANHFATKLVLLHVAPSPAMPKAVTRPSAEDVMQAREQVRMASLRRLEELTSRSQKLLLKPEFLVEFGAPSDTILRVAYHLQADVIVLGLHRSAHIDAKSHLPWATAYEVVCSANCSVLTVRN